VIRGENLRGEKRFMIIIMRKRKIKYDYHIFGPKYKLTIKKVEEG